MRCSVSEYVKKCKSFLDLIKYSLDFIELLSVIEFFFGFQRHVIRIVPVTEVQADWKQKPFTFFVYGLEGKVHTADYPQMWCCGCNIL